MATSDLKNFAYIHSLAGRDTGVEELAAITLRGVLLTFRLHGRSHMFATCVCMHGLRALTER